MAAVAPLHVRAGEERFCVASIASVGSIRIPLDDPPR
jgi:hypothetical protein